MDLFKQCKTKLFLKLNYKFIDATPDLHIAGSATKAEYILCFPSWPHIGRSDECCIGSFQHSRMNVFQNMLVIFREEMYTEKWILCKNLKKIPL